MSYIDACIERSKDCGMIDGAKTPSSIPIWVQEEIKETWRAVRDAGGQMEAFRILQRMVDRLGYGIMTDNPSLAIERTS